MVQQEPRIWWRIVLSVLGLVALLIFGPKLVSAETTSWRGTHLEIETNCESSKRGELIPQVSISSTNRKLGQRVVWVVLTDDDSSRYYYAVSWSDDREFIITPQTKVWMDAAPPPELRFGETYQVSINVAYLTYIYPPATGGSLAYRSFVVSCGKLTPQQNITR